jgi:hypothetical protein
LADNEDNMADEGRDVHLEERAQLIDAARESARTFDKAVLTFGAALFGFSVAFLKDVAPHPAPGTLCWLGGAWTLFSMGLLTILLSFLFSQQACQFDISESFREAQSGVFINARGIAGVPQPTGVMFCALYFYS